MRAAVASLLVLLAACSGDDGDGGDGGGDAGSDRPRLFGGARPVELQVPTDLDDGRAYPLLLVLHGYGVNASIQQSYLRLADAADAFDTLVLAPEGTVDTSGRQFWNADPACCDLGRTGVDDSAYLRGLLDDVMAAWPVDPARVTVVGHSNGHFMAYRLACDHADVVTAIAGLAGHAASAGAACAPSRPVSVLHLHGTADAVVPYESGTFNGVSSPGAVDSVAQWAARNGCTGAPMAAGRKSLVTGAPDDDTAVTVTGGCPAGGAAELWTIEGGSHIPNPSDTFASELMGWLAAHPR